MLMLMLMSMSMINVCLLDMLVASTSTVSFTFCFSEAWLQGGRGGRGGVIACFVDRSIDLQLPSLLLYACVHVICMCMYV